MGDADFGMAREVNKILLTFDPAYRIMNEPADERAMISAVLSEHPTLISRHPTDGKFQFQNFMAKYGAGGQREMEKKRIEREQKRIKEELGLGLDTSDPVATQAQLLLGERQARVAHRGMHNYLRHQIKSSDFRLQHVKFGAKDPYNTGSDYYRELLAAHPPSDETTAGGEGLASLGGTIASGAQFVPLGQVIEEGQRRESGQTAAFSVPSASVGGYTPQQAHLTGGRTATPSESSFFGGNDFPSSSFMMRKRASFFATQIPVGHPDEEDEDEEGSGGGVDPFNTTVETTGDTNTTPSPNAGQCSGGGGGSRKSVLGSLRTTGIFAHQRQMSLKHEKRLARDRSLASLKGKASGSEHTTDASASFHREHHHHHHREHHHREQHHHPRSESVAPGGGQRKVSLLLPSRAQSTVPPDVSGTDSGGHFGDFGSMTTSFASPTRLHQPSGEHQPPDNKDGKGKGSGSILKLPSVRGATDTIGSTSTGTGPERRQSRRQRISHVPSMADAGTVSARDFGLTPPTTHRDQEGEECSPLLPKQQGEPLTQGDLLERHSRMMKFKDEPLTSILSRTKRDAITLGKPLRPIGPLGGGKGKRNKSGGTSSSERGRRPGSRGKPPSRDGAELEEEEGESTSPPPTKENMITHHTNFMLDTREDSTEFFRKAATRVERSGMERKLKYYKKFGALPLTGEELPFHATPQAILRHVEKAISRDEQLTTRQEEYEKDSAWFGQLRQYCEENYTHPLIFKMVAKTAGFIKLELPSPEPNQFYNHIVPMISPTDVLLSDIGAATIHIGKVYQLPKEEVVLALRKLARGFIVDRAGLDLLLSMQQVDMSLVGYDPVTGAPSGPGTGATCAPATSTAQHFHRQPIALGRSSLEGSTTVSPQRSPSWKGQSNASPEPHHSSGRMSLSQSTRAASGMGKSMKK